MNTWLLTTSGDQTDFKNGSCVIGSLRSKSPTAQRRKFCGLHKPLGIFGGVQKWNNDAVSCERLQLGHFGPRESVPPESSAPADTLADLAVSILL